MKAVLGPYPPRFGGTEKRAVEEFESGENIFIGTSHKPIKKKNVILIKKRRFPIDFPLLLLKIFQNRKRIDRISAHYATTFGFVAAISKKLFGIPYSVTCHGTDVLINLKRPIHRFFTIAALKNAGRIIVVSKKLREVLIEEGFPSEKISLDIAGIDKRKFKKMKVKKKDQIIFVGKVQYSKGVDLLINAFIDVSKKFKKYRLLIVGDISEKDYYKKLIEKIKEKGISEKVSFLGNRKDIPKLLNESKLFVLSSRSEGYGIALAEALSCGLPCVATNVGGIPEVLEKYKGDCALVSPDAKEIANAIEKKLKKIKTK